VNTDGDGLCCLQCAVCILLRSGYAVHKDKNAWTDRRGAHALKMKGATGDSQYSIAAPQPLLADRLFISALLAQ